VGATDGMRTCRFLLISNILFWTFVALYSWFVQYAGNNNYLVIKILLFAEPLLYLICLIGIDRRIKLVYLFSIVLALGNTILSVTDQVGLSDVVSLVLSGLLFLNLVFIWRSIFGNTGRTPSLPWKPT
jgi:hypothetical protein